MADDLRLQLVVQAILDAKGFDDAKAALGAMAEASKKGGDGTDAFSTAQNVSRREVRLATAEILRYSGVTQEAGLIGRLAATGFVAFGDAAEVANFAIVGATVGLSVLIPLIIQWMKGTDDVSKAQEALTNTLESQYNVLKPFLETLKGTNAQYEAWAKHARDLELDKNEKELVGLLHTVDELNAKLKNLADISEDPTLYGWIRNLFRGNDTVETLNKSLADAKIRIEQLNLALGRGIPVEDMLSGKVKDGTKALEAKKKAIKEVMEDEKRAADFQKKQSVDAELDIVTFGQKQTKAWKDETKELGKHVSDVLDAKRAWTREEERLSKERIAQADAEQAAKEEAANAEISYIGQTATALSAAFGHNKALAIAGAIADTWAGATKALATVPWPANLAAAASVAATGLAQVVNIEKASASGFDDPLNDLLARQRGTKWARDLLNNVDLGFNRGLAAAGSGPAGSSSTTIDRSLHFHGGVHLGGFFGGNKNELLTQMSRDLNVIARKEGRATL
jgi:hypothetical protein